MHERTRRAVTRLVFVLGCALPTLLTLSVVAVTFTPWFANYRRDRLEEELSQRIGLTVEIDSVEQLTPTSVQLTGVRLLEPETKSKVAQVRIVTWVNHPEKTVVQLLQPELQSAMLPFVWRVIHERFLCQPELTDLPVRMTANDLTIHSRTGSITLRDVDTWLGPVEHGVEATILCVPAGRTDNAPIHISVIRDRSGVLPSTDWTMKTGGVPLPCSAIADYLPAMQTLGADATFMGTMRWRVADSGWSIDLGGSRIEKIDLSNVMRGMSHRLTGQADLRLETCVIDPGKKLDISGTLVAGAGFVSSSLLQEFKSQLHFELNPAVAGEARDWPYETMAVRFDLFGPDMKLEGVCHQQRGLERLPAGILLAAGGRGLCKSAATRQTWVRLVRALWPERGEQLPVSTQTAWLFGLLPAPTPFFSGDDALSTAPPRITSAGELHGPATINQP